ncbi:MAG: pH regulation protein F [Halomonas sp.]|uniref:Monovalent cation/H+ antiporter complex subunit F n=1 Tax=Vreelandella gomseomensis TaxID=370766 RepID=A0ABU1GAQ4_9GAMM|nr:MULTISPECIES: monovalent cation/H+ antiporter complex subunit F [Halomonas]MCA1772972.1 pH regulation protein F [Halomonas sp.]MCO7245035.1 monovalent cation/H+ antiporter complex subunit F [Halomonas sp. Mc5H-6]KPQ24832.1 MAG: multicomponent Na+:H+ antiporter subunit F [Halomonas sp. HL-48]MDR5874080.1 monovalent cation/H+ antiporter complex subunit F [Halomonas gomseomensis]MEC4767157.1 monovalent cation/H+ antiporter complex subunit F [Halomonas sp. CUBES01]
MSTVILLSLALMCLALCLAFVRLFKGPSLPDRVVALELFSSILVGTIGLVAIATDVPSLLDVAIVMALMAFMAAIGFARFLERGGPRDD